MENTKDYELARLYFKKLKCDVDIANYEHKTLEEFCEQINGHNFDGELFDVNYGNICATIVYRNNEIKLTKSVEVWAEYGCINSDYVIEN